MSQLETMEAEIAGKAAEVERLRRDSLELKLGKETYHALYQSEVAKSARWLLNYLPLRFCMSVQLEIRHVCMFNRQMLQITYIRFDSIDFMQIASSWVENTPMHTLLMVF